MKVFNISKRKIFVEIGCDSDVGTINHVLIEPNGSATLPKETDFLEIDLAHTDEEIIKINEEMIVGTIMQLLEEKRSTSEIKEIIVGEKAWCSRATFFRHLNKIRKTKTTPKRRRRR